VGTSNKNKSSTIVMIMLVADMKQNKTSFTPTRSEKTPTTTSSPWLKYKNVMFRAPDSSILPIPSQHPSRKHQRATNIRIKMKKYLL
jgi:hypothetical protein